VAKSWLTSTPSTHRAGATINSASRRYFMRVIIYLRISHLLLKKTFNESKTMRVKQYERSVDRNQLSQSDCLKMENVHSAVRTHHLLLQPLQQTLLVKLMPTTFGLGVGLIHVPHQLVAYRTVHP